jgi:DNA modification methylase
MAIIKCLGENHAENFAAYYGDCTDIVRQLPDKSVHLAVYSPPFAGLYIYNDSEADMGNCADDAEFITHYKHMISDLHRVMKPGRICAVHCKDLVYYKNQGGTAGLRDFPGDLIRAHIEAGFDFHSRVTIWRCPVREMTKTKAHGLLYKQLRADATFSRQGLPEYFLLFRKWAEEGEAIEPVTHTFDSFPLEQWQEWASPVWMTTRTTDVLHADAARHPNDERHICPMPLDLTGRIVSMYSNPGDTVLSPFMGIGSEGVVALRQKRKFIGIELKETYFNQACRYLRGEDAQFNDLFSAADAAE